MTMRLLSTDSNSKLAKTNLAQGMHEIYAGLSMMPDPIICPGSKAAQCMDGCLKSAGLGKMHVVAQARQAKTDRFHADRDGFVADIVHDLEALVRKARKEGKQAVVRLNVLSDITWESIPCYRHGLLYEGIPQAFPEIRFYDYTKRASRLGKTPDNYHLTFSFSGVPTYANQVVKAMDAGANMAVVFHVKKGQPLPKMWSGKTVIDGDEHDARIHDPKHVIVGLRAKGKAIKDTSGFVVRV